MNVIDVILFLLLVHGDAKIIKIERENFRKIVKARKLDRFLHVFHSKNLSTSG
jgi:hypothetical protein